MNRIPVAFYIIGLAVLCAAATLAEAQSSPLYIQDQGAGRMYKVQNGSVVGNWATSSNEACLAVTPSEIRTVGYFQGGQGYEYDLNGNPTGPSYTGAWNYTFEGTTDGLNNNYTCQYAGGGMVYSYDRTWQNPQPVASLGQEQFFGISYDSSNGSFWGSTISNTPGIVRNVDANGNILHQWNIPTTDHTLLAYDPGTDTVWSMSRSDGNNLRQWDKNGNQLQLIQVSGWSQSNILGMEFAIGKVPAPGAAGLLGIGGLVAARRRRS